jgi:hypothetical protein
MSAVDRMAVRTRSGEYRSLPRRQALALIAAGRAEAAKGSRLAEPVAPVHDVEAPTVPAAPESPHTTPGDASSDAFVEELGAEIAEFIQTQGPAWNAQPDDVRTVPVDALPAEPKATARRTEWADYAESLGVEVTAAMTKNQIRDAAQDAAQSLDRLPQPARKGGRLETPEDEPATVGTVADDEDPGTR